MLKIQIRGRKKDRLQPEEVVPTCYQEDETLMSMVKKKPHKTRLKSVFLQAKRFFPYYVSSNKVTIPTKCKGIHNSWWNCQGEVVLRVGIYN